MKIDKYQSETRENIYIEIKIIYKNCVFLRNSAKIRIRIDEYIKIIEYLRK